VTTSGPVRVGSLVAAPPGLAVPVTGGENPKAACGAAPDPSFGDAATASVDRARREPAQALGSTAGPEQKRPRVPAEVSAGLVTPTTKRSPIFVELA
jgi:hypothetical protein